MSILKRTNLKKYYGNKPNNIRALVTKPAIVLADEPTGNPESRTGFVVSDLLKRIMDDQTIIMLTRNSEIAQFSGRIVGIEGGKIKA